MVIEIKVPSVGESVTEALLAQWFKNDGASLKDPGPILMQMYRQPAGRVAVIIVFS